MMKSLQGDKLFFYVVNLWLWVVFLWGPLFETAAFALKGGLHTYDLLGNVFVTFLFGILHSLPCLLAGIIAVLFVKKFKFSLFFKKVLLSVFLSFFLVVYWFVQNDGRSIPDFVWPYCMGIAVATFLVLFLKKSN